MPQSGKPHSRASSPKDGASPSGPFYTVVKVQVPLDKSKQFPPLMVYNQDRTVMGFVKKEQGEAYGELAGAVSAETVLGGVKAYFHCVVESHDRVRINTRHRHSPEAW